LLQSGRRRLSPQVTIRETLPDRRAIGLLDSMLRADVRVPEDLSVVGYDDSRFARLPGIDLTSVRQDVPRMAELAVQAVVERLDLPPREPKDVALAPQLVVRGTGRVRGAQRPLRDPMLRTKSAARSS
jgi:DNA-binding LacI/PurR family transcriptional regulator